MRHYEGYQPNIRRGRFYPCLRSRCRTYPTARGSRMPTRSIRCHPLLRTSVQQSHSWIILRVVDLRRRGKDINTTSSPVQIVDSQVKSKQPSPISNHRLSHLKRSPKQDIHDEDPRRRCRLPCLRGRRYARGKSRHGPSYFNNALTLRL